MTRIQKVDGVDYSFSEHDMLYESEEKDNVKFVCRRCKASAFLAKASLSYAVVPTPDFPEAKLETCKGTPI